MFGVQMLSIENNMCPTGTEYNCKKLKMFCVLICLWCCLFNDIYWLLSWCFLERYFWMVQTRMAGKHCSCVPVQRAEDGKGLNKLDRANLIIPKTNWKAAIVDCYNLVKFLTIINFTPFCFLLILNCFQRIRVTMEAVIVIQTHLTGYFIKVF